MPTTRRTPDELAAEGKQLFERNVQPVLKAEDDGKFVAIDLDSGDFEVDADDYSAVTRLRSRRASGDFWLMRVGSPTTYRIGALK